ncbi:hypothetical protein REJC140_02128 [Pseudorhizobium endolithicum]|uniref:YjiS-like domain-containing protein n=1 Tax=Pseudorhizobium endolithicum TaxID=1191678 RepID=A0ABN7JYI7_9HYPH|nr:DUF1127 domain-containing protein [Pseudorhizobium endolithicum]CAD6424233.1 hypothetical protein REQ54_02594 [Rhizobium sp. Q54]CAD7054285.1 hypothetical protein REJC140_02128 [Pseudorhizobium endolithicum]
MSATKPMPAPMQSGQFEKRPRITVAQLFLRTMRRWQRNRAFNALSRLSNQQLEDIGISRYDIPKIVEGMFATEHVDTGLDPEQIERDQDQADVIAKSHLKAA